MTRHLHRTALALLLAQLAVLAAWPWLGGTALRAALTPCYEALCHQRPERCLVHGGEPMPVCARCLGVWLGLLLAAALAIGAGTGGQLWGWPAGCAMVGWMAGSWALGTWLPVEWHMERVAAGVAGGAGVYVMAHRAYHYLRRSRLVEPPG